MKLLMIDDDQELTELLCDLLTLEGFEFEACHDSQLAMQHILQKHIDLVLLDVMMPGKNGFDILREMRAARLEIPVLMLTAKGDEFDRVLGLELGADDYLPKPFSDRELLARIKAILRRTHQVKIPEENSDDQVSHDDLVVYPRRQEVLHHGEPIELTSTEFLLLEQFLRHPGEILDKAKLNEQVLGKKLMPFDRSLDMHVSNLRKKIPDRDDNQPRIKTVRGKGYLWLQW
ncbi:response regulator [Celerinatantimonas diazotrophica]|uniref:DNA-binding response OmpR family regulator n=1 Tax=Celerinatantimonas diazotrophica TaxID=412034 RepID=A0A4R1J8I5_9GAMM|nr:response regulator [Celerinatantimonas diazotrophica]TCK46790.1 DNA-binding response OmpR family regulator [Celerinatantimonas diazotrophica]CAG9295493.1 Transcriptional regulatory protein CpxR [Celerinatantimonas diazotrophica]